MGGGENPRDNRRSDSRKNFHKLYKSGIFICMRTTLNINDQILRKAEAVTGVKEKTKLVRMGLEALVAFESARRLARLGGSEKSLRSIPRRRS